MNVLLEAYQKFKDEIFPRNSNRQFYFCGDISKNYLSLFIFMVFVLSANVSFNYNRYSAIVCKSISPVFLWKFISKCLFCWRQSFSFLEKWWWCFILRTNLTKNNAFILFFSLEIKLHNSPKIICIMCF